MREKLIELYKILLEVGYMQADEEGFVSILHGDELRPATIDGKRLILPTIEQYKNKDWSNRTVFHPVRESYNLGVSTLISNLRDLYNQRLNLSIFYFMRELIDIAYDTDNQKNLTTEQSQVLNALSKCDESTKKSFTSLLKNTKSRDDAAQFINIFVKRGAEIDGRTYGRGGIVTFPMYDLLTNTKDPINGVKLTIKDRDMLIKLCEFIFPRIAIKNGYSVGVDSRGAPYLESLIRSSFGIAKELTDAVLPYKPLLKNPALIEFPENMGDWLDVFDSKEMVERLRSTVGVAGASEPPEEVPEVPEKPAAQETVTSSSTETTASAPATATTEAPRRRFVMGASSPSEVSSVGKATPGQGLAASSDRAVASGRATVTRAEQERLERERRELEDRERRLREREEEDRRRREREERRREEEEYERELEEVRRRHGRSRDRDDRDRGRDRDDRDDRRSGDAFDDNPVLRENLRDAEYDNRGRRRGYYDDDRDDRRRGRDRYDRYDRDRYDPRDDPRNRGYRRR